MTTARRFGTLRHVSLSAYWFAVQAQWGAIIAILVQSQVIVMVGDDMKGRAAGLAVGLGSLTAIVLPPVIGAWSDRTRSRFGRRRPYMVAGTLVNVAAFAGMAGLPFVHGGSLAGFPVAYWFYVGAYLMANLANNLATAPYTALMPDVVPEAERGTASGWLGLMSTLGNAAGILIAGSLVDHTAPIERFRAQVALVYAILGALLVLGMLVTVFGTRERAPDGTAHDVPPQPTLASMLAPFRSRDFTWVFVTRLFVTMGIFSVQNFLQFYMADVVREFRVLGRTVATTAEGAVTLMFLALLVVAVPSALVGGRLSDRIGRKPLVYSAGAAMALVAIGLLLFPSYPATLAIGALFGLGYGAYTSVDWALACDVLPSRHDTARDMGVWHVALTLPQLVATPLAGVLLDRFQAIGRAQGLPTLGYTVIFGLAVVYFTLGTVLVRNVRAGAPRGHAAMEPLGVPDAEERRT